MQAYLTTTFVVSTILARWRGWLTLQAVVLSVQQLHFDLVGAPAN